MRVLICSGEAVPYAKTGGLADVAGSLPKALRELGHDARLALPKYASVYEGGFATSVAAADLQVPLGGRRVTVSVETADVSGFPAYLVVSDQHFRRPALYGHPDDAERFIVFMRGLLEFLGESEWQPDLIHCNDWQTGLIPAYLETVYQTRLGQVATLYTVHNLAYQGNFPPEVLGLAGLPGELYNVDCLEFYGQVSFMKAGLVLADAISTVSPTYAQEIMQPEYGERLDGVLRSRQERLFGVLNGIDYDYWNPETDADLATNYSVDSAPEGKAENKAALQRIMHLPVRPVPLISVISRLASQKGFDLIEQVLPELMTRDVQFVVLGTGEPHYEQLFRELGARYPERMAAHLGFNEALAHQIYAGSDLFLMPSRYEPCGLGQMISMRYGTIPVVRRTGGLADTVFPFDPDTASGNGFVFQPYEAAALASAIHRGLEIQQRPQAWAVLMANAMTSDFSWQRSGARYLDVYQTAVDLHRRAPVLR